jgi:hypothetical protein
MMQHEDIAFSFGGCAVVHRGFMMLDFAAIACLASICTRMFLVALQLATRFLHKLPVV